MKPLKQQQVSTGAKVCIILFKMLNALFVLFGYCFYKSMKIALKKR